MEQLSIIDSGGVFRRGTIGPSEACDAMAVTAAPDESVVNSYPPSMDSYWDGGGWVVRPQRTRSSDQWDTVSKQWVDVRELAVRKADKWTAIKAARDAIEFGGFTWDGSTFDSDPESQSRIQGAAQLATLAMIAGQAFSVDWTLATNAVRTLTGADMLAVGQAMGVHIMTTHATGRALREAIEAAITPEQLESIAWPTT